MYLLYPSFKILASFCSWAGWFESHLVKNLRRHIFCVMWLREGLCPAKIQMSLRSLNSLRWPREEVFHPWLPNRTTSEDWSDYADAQAGLSFSRRAHISFCRFWCALSRFISTLGMRRFPMGLTSFRIISLVSSDPSQTSRNLRVGGGGGSRGGGGTWSSRSRTLVKKL